MLCGLAGCSFVTFVGLRNNLGQPGRAARRPGAAFQRGFWAFQWDLGDFQRDWGGFRRIKAVSYPLRSIYALSGGNEKLACIPKGAHYAARGVSCFDRQASQRTCSNAAGGIAQKSTHFVTPCGRIIDYLGGQEIAGEKMRYPLVRHNHQFRIQTIFRCHPENDI